MARVPAGVAGLDDNRAMPLPRRIAIALIAAALVLLAISHYHYGLAAQSGIVLTVVPLLFAGLLLGRPGLWLTTAVLLVIFALGCWVDLQQNIVMATMQDVVASLLQPVMGCAVVALILDRLIRQSDISHRRTRDLALLCRQLEIEMRQKEQSQAQLIHSQRMDSLGKLASSTAHDFNNLLSVVLGYATQHDAARATEEAMRVRMEKIVVATRRGKQLTDKLLTLARSDPTLCETFDANAALLDLAPMIRSMAGPRIDVRTALSEDPVLIRMDYAEFEAGVLNIAKNACDAMPDGGTFSLESEVVGEDVRLRFVDDGHGMPPDVAARIFEPFFTTKPRTQGTGIGLAVVYRTVTESGGGVEVDSTPGAGTRFTLSLPRQPQPTHGTNVSRAAIA